MIVQAIPLGLAKAFDETKHDRAGDGEFGAGGAAASAAGGVAASGAAVYGMKRGARALQHAVAPHHAAVHERNNARFGAEDAARGSRRAAADAGFRSEADATTKHFAARAAKEHAEYHAVVATTAARHAKERAGIADVRRPLGRPAPKWVHATPVVHQIAHEEAHGLAQRFGRAGILAAKFLLRKNAVAFNAQEHPRGDHGRFSSDDGGSHATRHQATEANFAYHAKRIGVTRKVLPSGETLESAGPVARIIPAPQVARTVPAPAAIIEQAQRRTLETTSSWHKLAGRGPRGFKGDSETELPIGSFTRATLALHKPKILSRDEHQALLGHLTQIIHAQRDPTKEAGMVPKKKGKMRGQILIPDGTEKRTINRAYNHAGMVALHEFGVGKYDFAMDDTLKAEMKPMVPFIHFARKRILATMLQQHRGAWQPYRQAFGVPFPDQRTDQAGAVRLRKPAIDMHQLVKMAFFGELAGELADA